MMHVNPETNKSVFLSDRSYNILKLVVTTLLPGAGTLYFTLAQIWSFGKAEEVVGTIAAVNVFLGLLLQISTRLYNKSDAKYDGDIDVHPQANGPTQLALNLTTGPEDLMNKKAITFKINDR